MANRTSSRQPGLTVRPVGRQAVLLELPDLAAVHAAYAVLQGQRHGGRLPGVRELVPGATTILLDGIGVDSPLLRDIRRLLAGASQELIDGPAGDLVVVETVYDGPDLEAVAALWGLSVDEAVALHSGCEHRVAFCGFAPGFAYISGLPEGHEVPRRSDPRPAVPTGSVALAGGYTGIYPRTSPGGWQLIGRTSLQLWDVDRDPPNLLAPGTRIRFRPVP